MFWADRLAGEIEKRYGRGKPLIIRDEKTVSGRVHIGSMRGVAIHGTVAEALAQKGIENRFLYEFNDFDPMDDIPAYLDRATFELHFGKPLRDIPSPDFSAKNFAEYFAGEFRKVIEDAGWHPEFYYSSELYLSGKMDGAIREALEHAHDIRRIYKEVSGSQKGEDWLPLSVICGQCGSVFSTQARNFDGKEVEYSCKCGYERKTSPFGGKAKLPWKVEWPAKWRVLGVAVEGAGKDHSTKGGARDVADHISREVFNYEPPFNIPYEFFLVGGRKMSASKGLGSSAVDIANLIPPKILRLALLGKEINQQTNFDPEGDTVPVLYDHYDKLAENYRSGANDDYARLFEFLGRSDLPDFLMRFSQVVFIVQMPHMDLGEEAEKIKGGALNAEEKKELEERAAYAKKWLAEYAPEKFVFKLQDTLPPAAKNLSPEQKRALAQFADFIKSSPEMKNGEELHQKLHELKEFKAVYLAFLGKESGPKAGWFLSVLDREFVLRRLKEASA